MTFTLPPSVTDNGVLQMYAEETGIMVGAQTELTNLLRDLFIRTARICFSTDWCFSCETVIVIYLVLEIIYSIV